MDVVVSIGNRYYHNHDILLRNISSAWFHHFIQYRASR